MNTKQKGDIAEKQAISFLESNGYEIVDTNFYTKFGEIDIIAKKNGVLHFIEAKSGENFESIYNVTYQKLQRILKSIHVYLKSDNISYQIDVITIDVHGLNFIQNVTMF